MIVWGTIPISSVGLIEFDMRMSLYNGSVTDWLRKRQKLNIRLYYLGHRARGNRYSKNEIPFKFRYLEFLYTIFAAEIFAATLSTKAMLIFVRWTLSWSKSPYRSSKVWKFFPSVSIPSWKGLFGLSWLLPFTPWQAVDFARQSNPNHCFDVFMRIL